MKYTSAGTILMSYVERKILLLKHPEGHWGFPKGLIEKGETCLQAAQRELFEETSIDCNFYINPDDCFFEESYMDSTNKKYKEVIYFVGITCLLDVKLSAGFQDYGWFTFEEITHLDSFYSLDIINSIGPFLEKKIVWMNDGQFHEWVSMNHSIMGSKHAYSRIAPLSIFCNTVDISNVPNTLDSYYIKKIIQKSNLVGKDELLYIDASLIDHCWSSINMLPFLVNKHKRVVIPQKPNGCRIGLRPVELYFEIMKHFGINILETGDYVQFTYDGKRKKNVKIDLRFPSFTGTSIAIYCAMFAANRTQIVHYSIEPEILFLLESVKRLGCSIIRNNDQLIIISACTVSSNIEINIPIDRNVLVTQIVDKISSNQKMCINIEGCDLVPLFSYFDNIGLRYHLNQDILEISPEQINRLTPYPIEAGHYPLLCSDWQPMLAFLMIKSGNCVNIIDTVFEDRFGYIEQIEEFYQYVKYENDSHILKNAKFMCPKFPQIMKFSCLDIRAAAVIFLLTKDIPGIEINNIDQLLRGYSSPAQVSDKYCHYGFFTFA